MENDIGLGDGTNDTANDENGVDTKDIDSQNQSSTNGLFGEYSDDPSIQKFKDPKDLAKSYIELQKMVGVNKIPIPKDENELSQVLGKLGKPDAPDKYPDYEDALNVFGSDDDFKQFKKIAHEADLLPSQYDKIYNGVKEIISQEKQATQQMRSQIAQQAVNKLQGEWGDEFNQKVKLADRLMKSFSEDVQSVLVATNLDIHPEFVKMMAQFAENYKEDSFIVSDYSPAEAKGELESILSNKEHPYFNKMHPEHEAALDKVEKLYKIIYG